MPNNVQTTKDEISVANDVCHVVTSDGVRLDGLLQRAAVKDSPRPVEVFLLLHGTGSNFYAPGVLERFARDALVNGIDVLRINTRGHDGICHLSGPGKHGLGGAAFEDVADCRLDVAAWIEDLERRGYNRICLGGHSMGGVKSIYAQAHDQHAAVKAVVAISSPRFCHRLLMQYPESQAFRDDWQRASRLNELGEGETLIRVSQPLPLWITAERFLSKYGPDDPFDLVRWIPDVQCPVHYIVGGQTVETSPAFFGIDEHLSRAASRCRDLTISVVPDADMNYSAAKEKPYELTSGWLRLKCGE